MQEDWKCIYNSKNNDFSIRFDNDSYINYINGTITIKAKNVKIVQDEE